MNEQELEEMVKALLKRINEKDQVLFDREHEIKRLHQVLREQSQEIARLKDHKVKCPNCGQEWWIS